MEAVFRKSEGYIGLAFSAGKSHGQLTQFCVGSGSLSWF
jgi:hypothetical protein